LVNNASLRGDAFTWLRDRSLSHLDRWRRSRPRQLLEEQWVPPWCGDAHRQLLRPRRSLTGLSLCWPVSALLFLGGELSLEQADVGELLADGVQPHAWLDVAQLVSPLKQPRPNHVARSRQLVLVAEHGLVVDAAVHEAVDLLLILSGDMAVDAGEEWALTGIQVELFYLQPLPPDHPMSQVQL
jgi:hypothetical protein